VLSGQIPGRPERADRLPLDELLPQVDALTLHCPLNEHTRHMLGARELALLKPGALVVNTARGGLIAFPNEKHTLGNRFLHQNGTVGQELRKEKLICH